MIGKPKKPKKITKAKLAKLARTAANKALAAWHAAGGDRCEVCGAVAHPKLKDGVPVLNKRGRPIIVPIHQHHILPKETYKEHRTNPLNRVTLCPHHHRGGRFSAHFGGPWFYLWLRRNKPKSYFWALSVIEHDPAEKDQQPWIKPKPIM